jgi:hypothetical protein
MTEEGVVLRLRDLRPSLAFPPLLFAPAYGGMLMAGRPSADVPHFTRRRGQSSKEVCHPPGPDVDFVGSQVTGILSCEVTMPSVT